MSQRLSKLVQYLQDGNYEMAVTTYNEKPQQLSIYQALELARAFLVNEHYEKCIQICQNLKNKLEPEIFFDANILLLKSSYLVGKPTKKIIKQLENRVKPLSGFQQRHVDTITQLKLVLDLQNNYKALGMNQNELYNFMREFRNELQKQQSQNPLTDCMPMFAISAKWFQQLEKFSGIGYGESKTTPGPITHFQILDNRYNLLHDPTEQKKYTNYIIYPAATVKILPKKCWLKLKDAFGGFELKRYNVWVMNKSRQILTEIYLKKIKIRRQDQNQVYEVQITKKQTWGGLNKKLRNIWRDNNKVILEKHQSGLRPVSQGIFLQEVDTCGKVYMYGKSPFNKASAPTVKNGLQSCKNCGKTANLKFCQCKSVKYCDAKCQKDDRERHRKKCQIQCNHLKQKAVVLQNFNLPQKSYGGRKGLVGLRNLGNTCYMNSGLQCLSNTKEITDYFMSNGFIKQINQNNPLGTKGYLACAYAELMREMWTGTDSSISPFNLKKIIGKFAGQFSGYGQQDSQQFISYLIDGLQEDLNLVKNKQTFETSDEIIPDELASQKSQMNYAKRTQSYIRDLMVGQFKSTVICDLCQRVSVCFDPFMLLSLPIPALKQKQVYFIPMDSSQKTMKINFTLDNTAKIGHLRQQLSKLYNLRQNETKVIFSIVDIKKFQVLEHNIADNVNLVDVCSKILENIVLIAYEFVTLKKGQSRYEVQYRLNGKKICFPRFVNMSSKLTQNQIASTLENSIVRYAQPRASISNLVSGFQVEQNKIIIKMKSKVDMVTCISDKRTLRLHSSERKVSLYDCLTNFIRVQTLEDNNKWYCNKCKDFVKATKQMQIYKSNKILVLAFKRFYRGFKIKQFIDFPIDQFDMGPYIKSNKDKQSILYDLYGVVNHYGTMFGGHYTAYCKNFLNNEWFEFDDSRVSKIRISDVVTQSAYVLFYRRRK